MSEPTSQPQDTELRALVERALSSSYDLDNELGRGGMGIVYRAKDRRLKRRVAIKVLPPELAYRGEIRSRFLREAETAAQLSHPNIVPIYSVDERDGIVYFVMACVDGMNLARRLHEQGRMSVNETRRLLREVGEALAYAHARGVIHRDIKPDNILLDSETGRAMVTDFGIARAAEAGVRLTATGVAIGTPAYMSPEQAAGDREIDGRSDLYSLGVVAYQTLTGELPFKAASTASMLMKHVSERPAAIDQLRADVPPDLAATVMTLLEKEPERRFPSASSFVLVIGSDDTAPYTPVPRPTPSPPSYPPSRASASDASRRDALSAPRSAPLPVPMRADAGIALEHKTPGSVAAAYIPTADDLARWSAAPVQTFRSGFVKYAAVNTVILIAAIFTGVDLWFISVVWSMVMAYKYAGLWSSGYDWRDVFRQPRDRRLFDVASETIDEARGLFDREARERRRHLPPGPPRDRVRLPPTPGAPLPARPGDATPLVSDADLGRFAPVVRQAGQDREEIARLVAALPRPDRALAEGVIPEATRLAEKIQALALAATDLERQTANPNAGELIESQIEELESQANPFDTSASEQRVRRLALLKRQRRALIEAHKRRDESVARLESCALALQNMRFDIVRLRAGSVSAQHVTSVTERARALAEEVDAAIYAADEVARATATARSRR